MKNKYPLPHIDDLFDQVRGEIMFSNIYLRRRYHELRIKDAHIHKTSFYMRYGHYKFVVLPFGHTNAPTTLMCLMNNVLNKYFDIFVIVILDDFLVYLNIVE